MTSLNLRWIYCCDENGKLTESFYCNGPWSIDDYLRLCAAGSVVRALRANEVNEKGEEVLRTWFQPGEPQELEKALIKEPAAVRWSPETLTICSDEEVERRFQKWWKPIKLNECKEPVRFWQNLHLSLRLHQLASQCFHERVYLRTLAELADWSDIFFRIRCLVATEQNLLRSLAPNRCYQLSQQFHRAFMGRWPTYLI